MHGANLKDINKFIIEWFKVCCQQKDVVTSPVLTCKTKEMITKHSEEVEFNASVVHCFIG